MILPVFLNEVKDLSKYNKGILSTPNTYAMHSITSVEFPTQMNLQD
jgi:hypothetical protein